ncbi:hypothetical protein B0H10DRAFT_2015648 [Mycena sp. CBHHK59/15]|nr:hypothetical protein B0H10DRAFT_2015648 [Mycena sp. CBHHK59/15]
MTELSLSRLPTEILHEIFTMVVFSEENSTDFSERAPWILSHVSVRWREAAISHLIMWSEITILAERQPPVAMLERQLQLSVRGPLNISFYQSSQGHSFKLFEALIACSSRWKRVSLTFSQHATQFLKALERVRGRTPFLHELNLQGSATVTGNPFAFEVAPELHHVTLGFWPMPIIPWSQLTYLSVKSTFASILSVLQLAQNLIHLSVLLTDHALDHTVTSHSIKRIHLPRATECLIFNKCVIDVLVLPQLKIFVAEPNTISALASLIGRSSCSLEKLGLFGSCSVVVATSILQASPALTELKIVGVVESGAPYLNALIVQLSPHPSINGELTALVSQLKQISISAEIMDQDLLLDMVEYRWRVPNGINRLEHVSVTLNEAWGEAVLNRLSVFQSEGLQAVVC